MTGSGARDPGPENRLPPRLAEWLLVQVLPLGKRGESIRGDLLEEFRRIPDPGARIPGVGVVACRGSAMACIVGVSTHPHRVPTTG